MTPVVATTTTLSLDDIERGLLAIVDAARERAERDAAEKRRLGLSWGTEPRDINTLLDANGRPLMLDIYLGLLKVQELRDADHD